MSSRTKQQGIELIARSLSNFGMNTRPARAEARRIRDLWIEALLRGESVEVPGLDLQICWRQQKGQLRPVPAGRLKNSGKTPIRLVEPRIRLKVSSRSTVYFEYDAAGNALQVTKPKDRSRRVKWTPGSPMPEQQPLQKDKPASKSAPPPTARPGSAHTVLPRPLPVVIPVEFLRPHQRQIIGSRTAMFRQKPGGRR